MKLRGTQQKTLVIVERTHRNMLEDVGRSSTKPRYYSDVTLPYLSWRIKTGKTTNVLCVSLTFMS